MVRNQIQKFIIPLEGIIELFIWTRSLTYTIWEANHLKRIYDAYHYHLYVVKKNRYSFEHLVDTHWYATCGSSVTDMQ